MRISRDLGFLRSYLESVFTIQSLHSLLTQKGGRTFSNLSPIAFGDLPQRKDLTQTKSYFESLYSYIFNRFYIMQKGREIKQFILTVCPIGRIPFRFSSPLFLEIGFLSPYFVSQFANRDRHIFFLGVFRVW